MTDLQQSAEGVARQAFAPVDEDALFRRLAATTEEHGDPSFLADEVKDVSAIREHFSHAMSALADVPPVSTRTEPVLRDVAPTELPAVDRDVASVRRNPELLRRFLLLGPAALHHATALDAETSKR